MYTGLGHAYSKKGDVDAAIESFYKAIALNDKDAHAYTGLGHAYSQKGNIDAAFAAFQRACLLDDKNVHAFIGLGHLYVRTGRMDLAELYFNKVLFINANEPRACRGLSDVYIQQGKTDKAIAVLLRCGILDKKDAYIQYLLGVAYRTHGKTSAVLERHELLQDLDAEMVHRLYEKMELK